MSNVFWAVVGLALVGCGPAPLYDDTDTDVDTGETDDTAETDPVDTDDDTDVQPPDTVLETGFEQGLVDTLGCTDTALHAWNEAAGIGLSFYQSQIFPQQNSEPESHLLTVGEDDFLLIVEIAAPVADNYCTDGLVEREVFNTYTAVSGEVVVTLEAPVEDGNGQASITLTGVQFLDPVDHGVTVANVTWTNIAVLTAWGG